MLDFFFSKSTLVFPLKIILVFNGAGGGGGEPNVSLVFYFQLPNKFSAKLRIELLYNTLCYNMVLNITQFKDGPQKCVDYTEK